MVFMKTPELAAPAGCAESLKAAVESGADAVYMGLDQFNARMKADNFDMDSLPRWADYVHAHKAKLYLAFNTLIKQSELDGAARLAAAAFEKGADALIMQDLGLVKAVRESNPNIVIHASTQMGVHNTEGARAVKAMGIARAVLSRETPLKDIAEIAKTGLETEVFVHGALCVSFSGNCYFSALVSGYSGNRGRCMQLCRKKYKAVLPHGGIKTGMPPPSARRERVINDGYLLSPCDLCLARELRSLADAGVASFKIEGRMRRPQYVKETVRIYKKALAGTLDDRDTDALNAVEHARGGIKIDYLHGERQ